MKQGTRYQGSWRSHAAMCLRDAVRQCRRRRAGGRARGHLHSPQHQRAARTGRRLVLIRQERDSSRSRRTPSASSRSGPSGSQPEDGKVIDAKHTRAAELRACFGPTSEPALQNFYAEIKLGSISFRGNGECLAVKVDFPQAGLFPVRCQLVLSGLPAPYVGGLLTTNTMTSKAAFGGDTDPPGYTQASIATIRLWKSK